MYEWAFCIFHVTWVVHGGPQSQVPFSGRDSVKVRRGQGHMQASLGHAVHHHGQSECRSPRRNHGAGNLPCVLVLV